MSGYVLSTNELARKRLEIQHNLYLDSSLELLGKANIKKGINKRDIARLIECSPSTLYQWLKRRHVQLK